jgi:hypothetical protein
MIVKIDRTTSFTLRLNWGFIKFTGPEVFALPIEEDERALQMTEVDLDKVQFVSMLKEEETFISAEEYRKRLKVFPGIPLDAQVVVALEKLGTASSGSKWWQGPIPPIWRDRVLKDRMTLYFDGTELLSTQGKHVLYLAESRTPGITQWGIELGSGFRDRRSFTPVIPL